MQISLCLGPRSTVVVRQTTTHVAISGCRVFEPRRGLVMRLPISNSIRFWLMFRFLPPSPANPSSDPDLFGVSDCGFDHLDSRQLSTCYSLFARSAARDTASIAHASSSSTEIHTSEGIVDDRSAWMRCGHTRHTFQDADAAEMAAESLG